MLGIGDIFDLFETRSAVQKAKILGTGAVVIVVVVLRGFYLVRSAFFGMVDYAGVQSLVISKIRQIETAIELARSEQGMHPWGYEEPEGGFAMADVIRALSPENARLTKGRQPDFSTGMDYLDLRDDEIGDSPDGGGATLLDPWGNEYRIATIEGFWKIRIWSPGENGLDENGAGDDIGHRPRKKPR